MKTEYLEPRWLLSASVTIADSTLTEGDLGSANMDFTLTRSGDVASEIILSYTTADTTADTTATAGVDSTAQTDTVTIAGGATSATISVPISGELVEEEDETFLVQLTGIVDVTGADFELAPEQGVSAGTGS